MIFNELKYTNIVNRRTAILSIPMGFGVTKNSFAAASKSIADAAYLVHPNYRWLPIHLHRFIQIIPEKDRLTLKKSVKLLPEKSTKFELKSAAQDADEIQKRVLWLSSNIIEYPFKDTTSLDYHAIVKWVAKEAGVNKIYIKTLSTFHLEKEIYKKLFENIWDKMSKADREKFINKMMGSEKLKDKASIIAASGAVALAALSTTVAFTGFAFYTSMSIAIASVAAAGGVVLPIAVYTSAASLIGILTGPVGWVMTGLLALGGLVLAGRANIKETTTFVVQIHALKVESLIAARVSEKSVFRK